MNTLHRTILAVVSCALFFHANGQDSARHEPRLGVRFSVTSLLWPGNSDLTEGRLGPTPNEFRLPFYNDGPAHGGVDGTRTPISAGIVYHFSEKGAVAVDAGYQAYSFKEDRYAYLELPKVRVTGAQVRASYLRPCTVGRRQHRVHTYGSWGGAVLFASRSVSTDAALHPQFMEKVSVTARMQQTLLQALIRVGVGSGRHDLSITIHANLGGGGSGAWAFELESGSDSIDRYTTSGQYHFFRPLASTLINDLTFSYTYYFQ
jgi:hypothetical protein